MTGNPSMRSDRGREMSPTAGAGGSSPGREARPNRPAGNV
jgi:hypothetical protein